MKQSRPPNIPEVIVETTAVAIAREATHFAIQLLFPVHIIGKPGSGKSSALWHIAQQLGGFYCEVSDAQKDIRGLYRKLLSLVGETVDRRPTYDLAELAYRCFDAREEYRDGKWIRVPQLLVIDEVQTLESTAFRELLRLAERCGLALVVAGNAERLAGRSKDAATWEQIRSRIACRRKLPGPSRRDCELIGSLFNLEGKEAYDALAHFGTRTNFRDMNHLLETASRLTGGTTGIRLDHLREACKGLDSGPGNASLLKPEAV